MKTKKILTMTIAVILACFLLIGCSTAEEPATSPATTESGTAETGESGTVKIGVSFYALSGEFNAALKQGMEKYMEDHDLAGQVELNILDATSDANKQNSQVETLIADQVDAIILVAGDADAQAIVVEQASEAGIPLIELCTSTGATDARTSYVGSDDTVSGRMLMEELGNAAGGTGKMVILHGPTGVSAEIRRHEGAEQVIEENNWDIEVVSEKVCNWSREEAMKAMENIIQSGMEFDIVFAENDEMAVGALSAMQDAGLEKDIVIGGIDAIPDAVSAVAEGSMTCTIFQDAAGQAEKVMEVAIQAANGETIEKSYDIPFQTVTKENAQDYM